MAGLRIHTVMSSELVGRIDSAASAAGVSRGEFVRRAVEQALEAGTGGLVRGSVPVARTPAPAEQASEQALGSSGRAGVRGRVPASAPAEQPRVVRAAHDAIQSQGSAGTPGTSPANSSEVEMAALWNLAGPRVRSSSVARPFRPAPKQGKK